MMIMISGPYRGGTNDDPKLIQQNLDRLEQAAYKSFKKATRRLSGNGSPSR